MSKEYQQQAIDILKSHKLKITPARVEALICLKQNPKPIGAQAVFAQLAKKGSSVDQATLYRTLKTFVEKGVVNETSIKTGHTSYFLPSSADKHYVICTNCRAVQSISQCVFHDQSKSILKQSGFAKITQHVFEFYGLCKKCAK
jgi:Fe2+ or Zn2+ uptake regulation protein